MRSLYYLVSWSFTYTSILCFLSPTQSLKQNKTIHVLYHRHHLELPVFTGMCGIRNPALPSLLNELELLSLRSIIPRFFQQQKSNQPLLSPPSHFSTTPPLNWHMKYHKSSVPSEYLRPRASQYMHKHLVFSTASPFHLLHLPPPSRPIPFSWDVVHHKPSAPLITSTPELPLASTASYVCVWVRFATKPSHALFLPPSLRLCFP